MESTAHPAGAATKQVMNALLAGEYVLVGDITLDLIGKHGGDMILEVATARNSNRKGQYDKYIAWLGTKQQTPASASPPDHDGQVWVRWPLA